MDQTDTQMVEGEGKIPIEEQLQAIIGNLQKEADDRVSKKSLIEQRWLEDLRQFHGKYDEKLKRDLEQAKKSTLYINQTRPKTNAMEARLWDMLFPTDDRNFGIKNTPVPEMTVAAENSAMQLLEARKAMLDDPENPILQQRVAAAEEYSAQLSAQIAEAADRARLMEEEIADDLKECRYAIQSRDVIHDACKLGTGIMKGPIARDSKSRHWELVNGEWAMVERADSSEKASFWRVDPWSFFPDMDATCVTNSDGFYERHLMSKMELRRLAKKEGFNADAIRNLLKMEPRESMPAYIADLRTLSGTYNDGTKDKYHVWECHKQMDAEEIEQIINLTQDHDLRSAIFGVPGGGEADGEAAPEFDASEEGAQQEVTVDPLAEISVTIWFCQGQLLKFGIHVLDSEEPIYSVFCLEKDEASIFGFGVPYLMRDSQLALSSAWRILMDNAGISSRPQLAVDENWMEPADGDWTITSGKVWKIKPGAPAGYRPFQAFDIPNIQAPLQNIIEMSKRNIDDETSIPIIAQGEQGSHVTQTAHGMSILMNSVNVVFRRVVRNWDDDMTVPNIRRLYDFKMQFSSKESIKGDYNVDARGSTVLLVREMQSANLMTFLQMFAGNPILGRFLKAEGLPALRLLVQTMMIPHSEVIKSDDEIADDDAVLASQPPAPDPEMIKLENQMNIAEMNNQAKMEIAMINRDTEMMRYAAQMNLKLEEINASLAKSRMDLESKERLSAVEAAMTEMAWKQNKPTAGGNY